MRPVTITIFLLLALTLAGQAQGLQRSFDQLNNKIRTAQELLRLFPDAQAQQLIDSAIAQRKQGLQDFRRGHNKEARGRLQLAHGLIDRAIEMLSQVPLERIREQVDDLLRQAESLVPAANNAEATRLLRQARSSRTEAQQAVRNRQLRKGMEHFRVAKFYAERSISLVNLSAGNVDRQTINDEKNRYDELYNRAREQVSTCQDPQAVKMVKQAEEQYQSIQRAVNNRNFKLALSLYYSNTRLLLRAIDLCRGLDFSPREDAIEAVEMLGDMINSVGQGQEQADQSEFIMNRVHRLYQQAQQALANERYQVAIRQAQLGRNVLGRLLNAAPQQSLGNKVQAELDRLEQDIDRYRDERGDDDMMLSAAENSARDAQRLLAAGNVRLALEMVYAGNRFLGGAQNRNPDNITKDKLSGQVEQLTDRIEQSPAAKDNEMLRLAGRMLGNARQALANEHYQLANEYIKIGFDLVEKASTR